MFQKLTNYPFTSKRQGVSHPKVDKMEIACNGNDIKAIKSVTGAKLHQGLSGNEMGMSVIKRVNKWLFFCMGKQTE